MPLHHDPTHYHRIIPNAMKNILAEPGKKRKPRLTYKTSEGLRMIAIQVYARRFETTRNMREKWEVEAFAAGLQYLFDLVAWRDKQKKEKRLARSAVAEWNLKTCKLAAEEESRRLKWDFVWDDGTGDSIECMAADWLDARSTEGRITPEDVDAWKHAVAGRIIHVLKQRTPTT